MLVLAQVLGVFGHLLDVINVDLCELGTETGAARVLGRVGDRSM